MAGTAHAAHLRVYEPLAAFTGQERRRWEDYVAAGRAPDRQAGLALERAASVRALLGGRPAVLPDLPEHAFVAGVDGVTLVCPWRTRVRAAEALMDFTDELADEVADAYLPRPVAEAALEELEDWRLAHPDARVHVRSSPWEVPVLWFLLVDAAERVTPQPGVREIVYRTPMSQARRRVARALEVVRRTMAPARGGVPEVVEDLARWLEEFHPRSLVELDYGGLVQLAEDLPDTVVAADASTTDMADALAAWSDGRTEEAGVAYARVQARMKALQALEGAN